MTFPERSQRITRLLCMLALACMAAALINACLQTKSLVFHCIGSGAFLGLALIILREIHSQVRALEEGRAQAEAEWQADHKLMLQEKAAAESLAITNEYLRESDERFRLIAENVSDLISIVDTSGKHLYSSPSYRQLGYSPEELLGESCYTQMHPEDVPGVKETFRKSVESGTAELVDYRAQHKDGTWRSLESFATPVRDACGQVEHLVIVTRDITERKDAETERQQEEVHLRHKQKMESIGQLAAGIAHEINTPTQYIRNNVLFLRTAFANLNTLREHHDELFCAVKMGTWTQEQLTAVENTTKVTNVEYLSTEIPNAIQESLEGIERVTKIVKAMKEFSHPGSSKKISTDLNKTIDSTVTVCRNEWKYVANLVTDFDPELPLVPCLAGEINQAVLNIVVNAAHAIADVVGDGGNGKGTITVSTRRDGDWVEIRISDTGTGIPEDARDHVFDPFFTTKEVGKGTGQGLAIAHAIVVKKHDGTITFETGTGEGTTFIIRLPLNSPTNE